MTEPEKDVFDQEAVQLARQLGKCHDAVMGIFKYAARSTDPDIQIKALLAASRIMRAGATSAAALKRLRSDVDRHHTLTVVHRGDPDFQNSKTNGHAEAAAEHGA